MMRDVVDRIAFVIHVFHGTRGLTVGAAGLFLLGLLDPILPTGLPRSVLVVPVFIVLVTGAATLPREGVALQQRARSLLDIEGRAGRLAMAMVWPVLLAILLAPRLFLAAYGVPHLSPLTGLVYPGVQQRVSIVYVFGTLLVAVMTVRATKRYGRHIIAKRPKDLTRHDRSHQERESLLWMSLGIAITYGLVFRGFWEPFSLLQMPPGLSSLARVRGVAAITFSITLPLLMFAAMTSYAALLREARGRPGVRDAVWLAILHIVLLLTVVVLHTYDLLWIAQYRQAAPF